MIEGAARLFRAKGFDGTSTRDIAAAVGMRSGSPFYHFDSKNALLYVVVQEGMAFAYQSQCDALTKLSEGASPREQLRSLVRQHFEVLHGPHADFIPVMLYEWRSLSSVQRQEIAAIKAAYEACWAPALEALHRQGALKADPVTARLFILGALNWSVQWFNPRGALSLDELTEQALDLFLGVRRERPANNHQAMGRQKRIALVGSSFHEMPCCCLSSPSSFFNRFVPPCTSCTASGRCVPG